MKIYIVSYRRSGWQHDGYGYFSNKSEAEKEQKESNESIAGKEDEPNYAFEIDKVREIKVNISKQGILGALNQYGGHCDNG